MRKTILYLVSIIVFFSIIVSSVGTTLAQMPNGAEPVPVRPCNSGCPSDALDQNCASSYNEWLENRTMDFWVQDPEVVAIGQNGERAKQLLWWVFSHNSLDTHPSILSVWTMSRNITYFLLVLATVLVGLGIIIGQKNNFNLKINVSNQLLKVALLLLYITFSATFVIFLIQMSDIIMQFFIKSLGADKIFNIFFTNADSSSYLAASERGYRDIATTGCSNLSLRASESVRFSKLIIMFTNVTYFVIGIIFILRKVVLWFMLIASPFIAILFPFPITHNTGILWIKLFFQWLFYGPLFGLFLGGVAKMWDSSNSIPFQFDFQRIGQETSFVFPTAISVSYNGPSIKSLTDINPMISSNYIDTFAEYLISLIMLWVVIILPWFLLRTFQDYCCDGINSIKNILLSKMDTFKGGINPPKPPLSPNKLSTKMDMKIYMNNNIPLKAKIDNIDEIKRANTDEIKKAMQISASKIVDVANFEINSGLKDMATKNIEYLKNPMSAQTPTERQQYMHLRSELFERATKGDEAARRTLSAITNNQTEQNSQKQELINSLPVSQPIVIQAATKAGVSKEKVISTFQTFYSSLMENEEAIDTLSTSANIPKDQTKAILKSVGKGENLSESADKLILNISKESGIVDTKVKEVIEKLVIYLKENKQTLSSIAQRESISEEIVNKLLLSYLPTSNSTQGNLEDSISLPNNVTIEEYEQIKDMWINHYEKGEVPVSDTVSNRNEWINGDSINITNILNKLLSSDNDLKKKALDEVNYILPIFLINNLKGGELLVYLKAKLEAAKQVSHILEKEKEIQEKIKSHEDLVDIPATIQNEVEKTMELKAELKPISNES